MKNLNWATKESAQRPRNFDDDNYILMNVNVLDIMNNGESDFKLDPYDRTGGENSIGSRLPYAIEHFKLGEPMDYPEVYYSKYRKKVGFDNGRHRSVGAFQLGHEYIPMFVFKDGIEEFKNLVRTKPIQDNNIKNFIEEKNPKNMSRKDFFDYIKNKINQSEHYLGKGSKDIEIQMSVDERKDYLAIKGYKTDEKFLLDTKTFLDLFSDLNLNKEYLKSLNIDTVISQKYDEKLDEEIEVIAFKFNFNQFYDLVCDKENKKLIFRLEDKHERGIYSNNLHFNLYDQVKNPSPLYEKDLNLIFNRKSAENTYTKNYKFGFSSLEQLKSWVHNKTDIKTLINNTFKISVYEVPENLYLSSNAQAIFNSSHSKLLEKINIDRFLKPDLPEPDMKHFKIRRKTNKI